MHQDCVNSILYALGLDKSTVQIDLLYWLMLPTTVDKPSEITKISLRLLQLCLTYFSHSQQHIYNTHATAATKISQTQ